MALQLLDADFLQSRMHGICVGEIEAMEGAGRTVCDFEDVPWEFTLDMARQVWDESRHTEMSGCCGMCRARWENILSRAFSGRCLC